MIHIDFDAAHRLATVGSLVEPMRRAFQSQAVTPARSHYDLDALDPPRTLLLMPAWQPAGDIGVKIATIFPGNGARGLPSVNAVYLLLSGQTGQPRALIDGRALTLLRTAAVSALAADLLAPAMPGTLLMVGTGALSRYLVEGHLAVRQYHSVLIWGRDPNKAAAVANDLHARGWPVRSVNDLQAAARSADVISCATLAEQPLIEGLWLKSVRHLDLVGSFKAAMRETDDECLRDACIAVDTPAALQESGDLIHPLSNGIVEKDGITLLSDLAARAVASPRADKSVFKSIGVAHADLAAAQQLFERHCIAADAAGNFGPADFRIDIMRN
jgi:ornithine cyclodeaminase/alanine dehydrogenase-like protein (mu-crystallin family)